MAVIALAGGVLGEYALCPAYPLRLRPYLGAGALCDRGGVPSDAAWQG